MAQSSKESFIAEFAAVIKPVKTCDGSKMQMATMLEIKIIVQILFILKNMIK